MKRKGSQMTISPLVPKMKKGTKYAVLCVKTMPSAGRWCRKGHFLSKEGKGTGSLQKARIYTAGSDDFGWDDGYSWGCPGEHFKPIHVKLVVKYA